jgi:hypothetical protein
MSNVSFLRVWYAYGARILLPVQNICSQNVRTTATDHRVLTMNLVLSTIELICGVRIRDEKA